MHKGSISACLHTSEIQRNKNDFAAFEYEIDLNFAISYQKTEDERDAFAIAS